jgi:predicted nuclease of predicted toxin-antitoxin system
LASAVRLYFDENMQGAVLIQLRRRGIDIVTVQELGQRGASDESHIIRAREMQRVICTNDQDFLRLASSGITHAGLVFGSPHTTIGDWVKSLELLCEVVTAEDMENHIEYL